MKGLSQEEAAIANYIHSTIENIMAHTQQIPEGPLRDEPTNPRTRVVGMRWIKLGEGKDPAWGTDLFLYRKLDNLDDYHVGTLHKIESTAMGKQYSFIYNGEDATATFTHYAIPQPPKI